MLTPMSMAHSFFRRALLVAGMLVGVGGQSAFAAEAPAADIGWFEPQSAAPPAPAVPPAPAGTAAGPTPGDGSELPSLQPSPLMQQRGGPAPAAADGEDRDPRALSDFRPALDPYGTWVQHPTYGTVWVPRSDVVGSSFAPYVSSGRWALDEDSNWVWVSDYPFGRVVFHYGRWVWAGGTGWAWVPGYRYAPAWVHWRVPSGSYAYVGWAPMGPDYVWYNGVAVSYWYGVSTPWVFCPSGYVFHSHVHHHVVRDRVLITRLATHTRRYAPASRVGASVRQRAVVSAGPSLSAARVPASAVPQRIRAMPAVGQSAVRPTRFSSSRGRDLDSPRTTSSPRRSPSGATPARLRAEPAMPRPRSFEPSAPRPRSTEPSAPRPRSFEPSAPRPRSIEPSAPRPRSFEPSSPRPRSFAPSSPRSFAPSSPRSFSPSPRSGSGGGSVRPSLPRGNR